VCQECVPTTYEYNTGMDEFLIAKFDCNFMFMHTVNTYVSILYYCLNIISTEVTFNENTVSVISYVL